PVLHGLSVIDRGTGVKTSLSRAVPRLLPTADDEDRRDVPVRQRRFGDGLDAQSSAYQGVQVRRERPVVRAHPPAHAAGVVRSPEALVVVAAPRRLLEARV